MNVSKLYQGCAILFLIFTLMLCEHQKITFKYVRCNGTEEYFFNLSCYAKSYSRNFSTMNFVIYSKKSVNAAFVSWEISSFKERCHYCSPNESFLFQMQRDRLRSNCFTNMEQFIAKWCTRLCSIGAHWWMTNSITKCGQLWYRL